MWITKLCLSHRIPTHTWTTVDFPEWRSPVVSSSSLQAYCHFGKRTQTCSTWHSPKQEETTTCIPAWMPWEEACSLCLLHRQTAKTVFLSVSTSGNGCISSPGALWEHTHLQCRCTKQVFLHERSGSCNLRNLPVYLSASQAYCQVISLTPSTQLMTLRLYPGSAGLLVPTNF